MKGLKQLGESLLGIAPTLANALLPGVGGVIAGSAVKAVSAAMGAKPGEDPGTPERLAQALSGGLTPEQMAALKKADNDFALQMKELDVDVMRIHADDRASARRMQVKTESWLPPLLAVILTTGFLGSIGWTFYLFQTFEETSSVHPAMLTLLGGVIGSIGTIMTQVVAFYFGSSAGSDKATQHLADAANGRKG